MTIKGEDPPTFFGAYGEWMGTPPPTWEDLRWLIDWWDGPVMLKGIARPDDARRAVDAGATAISVSNHGGNNLDGQPASIRTLPGIVEAVGGEIEILLDSGVRRGSDTVKALALGARATMIGRAYLWGLAANGQAGVENVLDIFSGGIDSALRGLGRASVSELGPGRRAGARRLHARRRHRPSERAPMRIVIDRSARVLAGGTVVIGGRPARLLRLTPAGGRLVSRLA